jgi:hypothetical protein
MMTVFGVVFEGERVFVPEAVEIRLYDAGDALGFPGGDRRGAG